MTPTKYDIEAEITSITGSTRNSMIIPDVPAFGKPLIGYARGDDPLFRAHQNDIGSFLLTPPQWLEKRYQRAFDPSQVSVVCWVLPQTGDTRASMAAETRHPSYAWSLNRTFGEAFNRSLSKSMEEWFIAAGYDAVSPMTDPSFHWETSMRYGFASSWSERHAAHIAGLGTFGLCDGLISPLGKAVRYGSVIVNLALEPSIRAYRRYDEYCLKDQGCRACAKRCPAGAITAAGHDKDRCYAYQKSVVIPYARSQFHFEGEYGCGLCQTRVPCETRVPARINHNPVNAD